MPPLPSRIGNIIGVGLLAQLVEQLTFNQLVAGSNPAQPTTSPIRILSKNGLLAQLVEQLTFNQLVAGSNPAQPTTFFRFTLLQAHLEFSYNKPHLLRTLGK